MEKKKYTANKQVNIEKNYGPVHMHGSESPEIPRYLTSIPHIDPKDVIGRDDDLLNLRALLEESSSLLLMNGIGGIGKTTLAKIYVHRYGKEYDHLAWIELRGNLLDAVTNNRSFLDSLGVAPYPDEPIEYLFHRTMHALQNLNTSGHNLLVLDNVDNSLQQFESYLPHGHHWHVLLTSRQRITGFRTMWLGTLQRGAAIEFFRKQCSKPQDDQALISFLEKIQYHTLSIELFAKILDAHLEMETVEELDEYLKNNQLDAASLQTIVELEHAGGETTLYRHLLQAFDLSGIAQRLELMRLLKQMAALPPTAEGYPAKDLVEWFQIEEGQTTTFANNLQTLYKLGWLMQPAKHHYGTHRLIKAIVAHAHPPTLEDLLPLVETFTAKLSLDQTKDNPVDKFPWIPYGQAVLDAAEHLEFNEKATLQNNLALVLKALGDYQGAKGLLLKAMESAEKNFGPDHPTTAVRYSNLAAVLKDLGDYKGAKGLLLKAMESAEKNFGPDHPTTAVSYSNLATVLQDLGDYKGAKGLLLKAMESDEKNFGPDHPTTAVSYSNLAAVLQDLGDYKGAKGLLLKAMESAEKNFGPDHPTTAVRYSNLAAVLKDLGDYKGAKGLLLKAMESAEKNFGPDHPTTAVRYSNLAAVLKDLGDYKGAKGLLLKAMESAEKNFGPDHPTTAVSYSNLALVLQDLGDYKGAKGLLLKAMESAEKNFGPDHPTTAVRYSNLAAVLKDLGDYKGAKGLLLKAMESAEKNFGPDHPTTAVRYSNLALVLQALGDYQGAKGLLLKAMESDEKNFGPDHPTTAVSYSNLAAVLKDLGDYKGAKGLLLKAMESDEKNFGPDHPTTAVRYSNLALVLKDLGDYKGAKGLLLKAMESAEKNFGPDHPTTAVRYSNLAAVLAVLGDYDASRKLLNKALSIFKKYLGENHPNTKTIEGLINQLDELEGKGNE